ncbi:hypothetical protein B0I37DRAFT_373400 [Chaetomium sp. MPI-CAGE-AT-0009]|nr:hypothetical protein B0I37DRAFT_373400 [Chaetomium sp. MPI-CAGE-AT-0009]
MSSTIGLYGLSLPILVAGSRRVQVQPLGIYVTVSLPPSELPSRLPVLLDTTLPETSILSESPILATDSRLRYRNEAGQRTDSQFQLVHHWPTKSGIEDNMPSVPAKSSTGKGGGDSPPMDAPDTTE